jgi:taurine dioxygenase
LIDQVTAIDIRTKFSGCSIAPNPLGAEVCYNQCAKHFDPDTMSKTDPLDIVPLNAPLGAEIHGIDASQTLSTELVSSIDEAWDKYHVLILRNQKISDTNLLAFTKLFGELDPPGPNPFGEPFLPSFPEINVISNVTENGRPIGNLGDGEAVWHADMTYAQIPPKAALLYAIEIPPSGGDTYFANMYTAYDTLPAKLKAQAAQKKVIHDASHNSAGVKRKGFGEITDIRATPGAHHPLVRTDPNTGAHCLFLGRRPNAYVIGLDLDDSEKLLNELWSHATQEDFTMRHQWQQGDLLMWRNLNVIHRRDAFDPNTRRIMHRTQIKGDERIR